MAQLKSASEILAAARQVLTIEADALRHLCDAMPADFVPALERIMQVEGRVIVCGIGKSGHIGRKIAATLASTGTPSFFVHAAEASHGDLGMVTEADICLLISNSGETSELRDMIYHTQRFSIPLIAISSNPDSTLMRAADYKLTLPKLPEACPMGMAPTTSTTLTLALGDALAVALMEVRGFKDTDFGIFHPGGKLGAQMRRVSEMMHSGASLPFVDWTAPMSDVLVEMSAKGFGIAIVMKDGKLFGVISDGDLRRNMDGLMQSDAAKVANRSPVTIAPDTLAAEGLAILNQKKISVLLVVEDEKPVGVLHVHDFLRGGVM
ncbi:KpsF/GutQ family sugar-phosphate isomerase [Thioclava sp. GXIMD4216]|uniref:KpsF/GutQ family sugar-phosphate isomerase n=1 Tax=Thioclava litoralis TaxID=3076557 RepID=A0ABZ1E159_9RHOB|nr:KpsF/GutQ family sugar-phosphate isomerase [Thioclava sp. FTW29]